MPMAMSPRDIPFHPHHLFQSYPAETAFFFTFPPCQHKSGRGQRLFIWWKKAESVWYKPRDTGLFLEETPEFSGGKELDLLSLDCCFGKRSSGGWGAIGDAGQPAGGERLQEKTVSSPAVPALIVNHFSHNCGQLHDELVEEAARYGFEVAYDGIDRGDLTLLSLFRSFEGVTQSLV